MKHVCGRSRDFNSLVDICFAFMEDAVNAGAAAKCPEAWQRKTEPVQEKSQPSRGIVELSTAGPSQATVHKLLKESGRAIGARCSHVGTGLTYDVVSIKKDCVVFKWAGPKLSDYKQPDMEVSFHNVHKEFKNFVAKPEDCRCFSAWAG